MNPDIDNTYTAQRRNGRIERITEADYTIALAEENARLRQKNDQLQDELDQLKEALRPFTTLAKMLAKHA